MKNQFRDDSMAALYASAANMLQQGDLILAEQYFTRLLDVTPNDLEALQFVASRHLFRGDATQAVQILLLAKEVAPNDAITLHQLSVAQMAVSDFRGAAHNLRKVMGLAPQMFIARLRFGMVLEELGNTHEALITYAIAIRSAQEKGCWLNDETTAPGLRDGVLYAIRYVNTRKKELFQSAIEPLRLRYGRSELSRVEHSLEIYLGEMPANIPDARQVPKFLYFPDIPSQPYYPSARFPWAAELEANTAFIREELLSVLSKNQPLESFLQISSPRDAPELLKSSGPADAAWDAYFFHRHGDRYDEHCVECPRTAALLDSLPLARVRDHSPETLFSILRPGTHILPHTGVTNTRLVTHLPLIVPPDCALIVGGETHVWEEGRCVTFDDTFEHQAWNKSTETRVVLIVDSWNPDLSEAERAAVADLVGAIGDFNRACEMTAPVN